MTKVLNFINPIFPEKKKIPSLDRHEEIKELCKNRIEDLKNFALKMQESATEMIVRLDGLHKFMKELESTKSQGHA